MNLFSWGRGDDDAPVPMAAGAAPADANAAQRPRPAALHLGGEPVDDDAAKWARSRARWNLAIKPDSPDFVRQRAVFEAALDPGSGKSIEDTLKEHFSNYEAHKFSGWADRAREPDLYRQQKRDAAAYNTLLTSAPWAHEAPKAFLAFKMTMLYFGFSVEPMKMNDFFRLPPGSGLFGLDDDGEGDGDLDDQRTFVPEEMRPLRFLNRYDKRSYGADNGHMMPDPTFEMYYGLPFQPPKGQQHGRGGPATGAQADMRIRGRGLGEDKDEHIEDDSMSDGSVDGASFCSDSLLPDAPDVEVGGDDRDGRVLNLRGGSGGSKSEDNVTVSSFSGYASCNFHFARAFYAAVDTALVLGARVNVQITVALIRAVPYQFAKMVKLERGTLGSVQSEKDLHDRLLTAYTQARRDSAEGSLGFFICHTGKDQALIELQQKGQGARTSCAPTRDPETFQFEKQDSSGTSGAYLWMPPAVGKVTAANLYAQWFKTVVRITSGPHGPTQTLGRPSVQVPRADYKVQVGDISPSFHHESPLPREVWEAIAKQGRQSGAGIKFNLSFTSLGRQAFAQVPGYYPRDSTTAAVLNTEAVFQLAWDSVPLPDRSSVARMVIRRPGDAGTAVFTCKNGSVDHSSLPNNNSRAKLLEWLEHKYFFNIVPEWDEYDATVRSRGGESSLVFKFPGRTGWSDIRSHLLAACSKAGWNFGDGDIGQVVLCIDQRTAVGEEARNAIHKNRIAWYMDIGFGPKENKLWSEFRAALSVKRVTMEPLFKYKQDQHGNPAATDPLASDGQQALWNRWGCNRGSVNVGTGEPVVESPPIQTETQAQTRAQTQTQAHGHDHRQDGNNHHGQPAQAQDQDQGILHQGVPQLGAGVDIFQSGKYYREQSFATPLSVQVGDQKPRFPINAPPIEHIRRPRGPDGIESDSMPIVSTQIMTPTEQRTLQQAFFQMRSIALNRAQQCPHKDCTAFFPVGPGNMAAFHAHLDAKHVGTHCPFCDETLFKYWSPADRQKHFVNNHSEYFTAKGDLLREAILAAKTKSKGNVDRREEQYSFCPRCGRNHQLLSSKADRVHHDNVCFPGNEATLPTEQYCRRCGQPDHVRAGTNLGRQGQRHQCAATGTDLAHKAPASDIFCSNCALECHQLPASYGRRHMLNCKPLASKPDSWCPWCGVDLKSGPRSVRLKHLANCTLKPPSGQNPVCTDSGIPFESPRDHKARLLKHGLSNLGMVQRNTRIAVPPKCPVKGCRTDLTSWNAQGLYYHFQSHPENVLEKGGGLKSCPFCACNFEMRGFHTSFEKQQHFDAHIKQQHRRVLDDETIGSNPDRQSSAVVDAISTSRYDGRDQTADEIDYLRAENEQLSENVKRLAVDNRKFRDAQLKSQKKHQAMPATPYSTGLEPRRAASASRLSFGSGTDAPVSKRKDGAGQDLTEPPSKKSKVVHHGPSTTTVPGFATGRQVLRSVPDAGEDWGDEDDEDELSLESEIDVEEGIIDYDEDDDEFDDGLEDDDYDELAD